MLYCSKFCKSTHKSIFVVLVSLWVPLFWVNVARNKNCFWVPPCLCSFHRYWHDVSVEKFEQVAEFEPSSIEVIEEDCFVSIVSVEPSLSRVYPELIWICKFPYPPCFASTGRPPEHVDGRRSISGGSKVLSESEHSASISKNNFWVIFRNLPDRFSLGYGVDACGDVSSRSTAPGESSELTEVVVFFAIRTGLVGCTFRRFEVGAIGDGVLNPSQCFTCLEANVSLEMSCS